MGDGWIAEGDLKLLAGEILVANPSRDHRETHDYARAADRIFLHRKQLGGAAAFVQRFLFSSKRGVD